MKFDKNFFVKQEFATEELAKYKESASRDLEIAKAKQAPAVVFHFAYMALLKIGIYHIGKEGYRAKSRPGHHMKIIEALSGILEDEEVLMIGDKMRKDRNLDLYEAGALEPVQNADQYLEFVERLYQKMN